MMRQVASDLTVVIPTLGRDILRSSLAALLDGSVRPARVVVIHQGDDPRVADWARAASESGLNVDYVPSEQHGRAAAVNRGIERVQTTFVAITDDDCLAAPDWVENLVKRLRANPEMLVTGRVEPEGEHPVVATVMTRDASVQTRPRLRHDSLSGGNMGGAVELLQRIGPLDEDPFLAAAEDVEYAYRTLRSGVPIVYDPGIVVSHVGWRAEAERLDQYDRYARSLGGFLGKYLRQGDAFIAARTVVHLLRSLRRWALGTLRGDLEAAAHGRAYFCGLLPGLVASWRNHE